MVSPGSPAIAPRPPRWWSNIPHVTTSDLRDAICDYLVAGGWLDLLRDAAGALDDPDDDADGRRRRRLFDDPDLTIEELIDEHLDVIAFICNRFEPGTVISRSAWCGHVMATAA